MCFNHVFYIVLIALIIGCASGKKAYERGDYYGAVMQSVERLRQKPDHTKSQEALRLAYPLAIDFLESQAQTTIASDAPFKWKDAMGYYNKINYLYNEIRQSPAALTIIKNPVSKFTEIADLKKKAAEESYEAGIQALMKNTRQDAIKAYYLFDESNKYDPGIRDVVEMQHQAEVNATLRVVYTEMTYRGDWVTIEPVVNSLQLPFTKFYTSEQAQTENLPIHHTLLIEVLGYNEDKPTISKTENSYVDSVATEKTIAGKKEKVYDRITGRAIVYEKKVIGRGIVRITIKEKETTKQLLDNEYVGSGVWSERWASCFGDKRAIPEKIRRLCSGAEPKTDSYQIQKQAKQDVSIQIKRMIESFYRI